MRDRSERYGRKEDEMMDKLKDKMSRYIDAGLPILYISSFEDERIDTIIKGLAGHKDVVEWNGARGLVDLRTKAPLLSMGSGLAEALGLFQDPGELEGKILVLRDIYRSMEDPEVAARLKDIASLIGRGADATVIIVSTVVVIPPELERYITVLEMGYLSAPEIRELVARTIREDGSQEVEDSLLDAFSTALKGLSETEIRNILALAYADDGELSRSDLGLVFEQKQQTIKKAGILEMVPLKEDLEDIGGLERLKAWLERKARVCHDIERAARFGVDMPKGVLVAGVPGCGKSLSAKATAKLFQVPLLRLDMGRLMGKYVGESEANMRRAVALAEAIAPCVLWIDELEKAFAGIGSQGGGAEVTTRLFGYFLTWLQEKESQTFVVATANDVAKLPPELMRKGRFDEVFYIGLPTEEERRRILGIHIRKRRPADLGRIDTRGLAQETKGFSGADLEGVVKAGIEAAFAEDRGMLRTEDIRKAVRETRSLMDLMGDGLRELMEGYEKRGYKNASS